MPSRPLLLFVLSLCAIRVSAESILYSYSPCGKKVVVDCKVHKISFEGGPSLADADKTIDCGAPSSPTYNGEGNIGGDWVPDLESDPIKNGVDINNIDGMGKAGGGAIFHECKGGARPSGRDNSHGCIHVSPKVLGLLHNCSGTGLIIQNAANKTPRSNPPLGQDPGSLTDFLGSPDANQ